MRITDKEYKQAIKQDAFDILHFEKCWKYDDISKAMDISTQEVKHLHRSSSHVSKVI